MENLYQSTVSFNTPENRDFYREKPYQSLNHDRREIRLLQVHPERLTYSDIIKKFPHLKNSSGVQALGPNKLEPMVPRGARRTKHPNLPNGWDEISYYGYKDPTSNYDYYDYYYYRNKYTGKSQWKAPTKSAPRSEEVIVCQLVDKVPIASVCGRHSYYSTLSYCAGSRENVAKILVNGLIFNAFENLEHALDCVRSYWSQSTTEKLLIWVDQVCINQAENEEKSRQVAMMRDIFQGCRQVFACLSTKYSFSPGIDLQACRRYLADCCPGQNEDLREPPPHQEEPQLSPNAMERTTANRTDSSTLNSLILLQDMVSADWWTRAWVFQEVMLPSRVFLLFDRLSGSWPEIFPILSCFCRSRDVIVQEISNSVMRLSSTPISKPMRRKSSFLARLLDLPSQTKPLAVDTNLIFALTVLLKKLQIRIAASGTRLASTRHILEAKTSWTGNSDLRTVVENLHRFSATDPRDLVYAFLGLIGPDSGIEVDYSPDTTLHHVFISVAQSLIRQENKLDILDDALRRGGEFGFHLPGWVPDWTASKSAALELPREVRQRARVETLRASKSTNADASFHTSPTDRKNVQLEVTGIEADVLTQIYADNYGHERYFVSERGHAILTTASAQLRDTVWVIFGAASVFVLRRQSDHCYALVSTAFILDHERSDGLSGIMHGECIDLHERGAIQACSIRII